MGKSQCLTIISLLQKQRLADQFKDSLLVETFTGKWNDEIVTVRLVAERKELVV